MQLEETIWKQSGLPPCVLVMTLNWYEEKVAGPYLFINNFKINFVMGYLTDIKQSVSFFS